MNFRTMKIVAALAVALFGVSALSSNAQALDAITANIEFDSAINTSNATDLEFGTYLAIIRSSETVTLTMNNLGAVAIGGVTDSTVQYLAGAQSAGGIQVDLPAGTSNVVLQMDRTAATPFANAPNVVLSAVTYSTAIEGNNQAFLPLPATEPVTVVAGGTPQQVTFGATISITGTPNDGPDSSSFDVSFNY